MADPQVSHGVFNVAAEPHQITIKAVASPFGGGAAYFPVDLSPLRPDHFVCYEIKSSGRFKQRKVVIDNQFEKQQYYVLVPKLICAPSTKKLIK